jgi:Glycerol-3-phosphate dehydrogenase
VIASESELVRYAVQQALHSALFRVFASDDVHGVELGGAAEKYLCGRDGNGGCL